VFVLQEGDDRRPRFECGCSCHRKWRRVPSDFPLGTRRNEPRPRCRRLLKTFVFLRRAVETQMAVPTRLRMYEMGDLGGCSALWHPLRRRASPRLSSSRREASPDVGGARTPASQTCDTPPHAGRSGGAVRTRLNGSVCPRLTTRRDDSPPPGGTGQGCQKRVEATPPWSPPLAPDGGRERGSGHCRGHACGRRRTWGCWGRRNPGRTATRRLHGAGGFLSEVDDRAGQCTDDPIDQLERRDDHLA
jgi:hypothetical protein